MTTKGRPELQKIVDDMRAWLVDPESWEPQEHIIQWADRLSALVTVEAHSDAPGRPVMDQTIQQQVTELWHRWRKSLTTSAFTHADGLRYLRSLEELFASQSAALRAHPDLRAWHKDDDGTKSALNFPYAIERKDQADTCSGCGGPYVFDTSIPSAVWNDVIRAASLPEYLCLACIVREFGKTEQSFTAVLSGAGFHLVPIEVRFRSQPALDIEAVNDENNRLRQELAALRAHPDLRAWQGIETAPKDGTHVLVYIPDQARPQKASRGRRVAYWHQRWNCWQLLPSQIVIDPTHWMPLPDPPDAALRSLKEGRQAQTEAK